MVDIQPPIMLAEVFIKSRPDLQDGPIGTPAVLKPSSRTTVIDGAGSDPGV
jgi:hypothetical protein